MSYKERLTQLEAILQIDKLSKKYNLKGRNSQTTSSTSTSSTTATSPVGGNNNNDVINNDADAEATNQLPSPSETHGQRSVCLESLSTSTQPPSQSNKVKTTSPDDSKDKNRELLEEPEGTDKIERSKEEGENERTKNRNVGAAADEDTGESQERGGRNDTIDLIELKKLVFQGLPGDSQYRPLVWRLLLNYLPPNSIDSWDEYLAKKRKNYKHFVEDLLLNHHHGKGDDKLPLPSVMMSSPSLDHPLNPEPDSKWQVFFKDNDVLLQIDKDVRRLCPEISFFQSHTPFPNEYIVSRRMDRLHKRVQSCVLESSSLIRKGLGITKLISKEAGVAVGTRSSNNNNQHFHTNTGQGVCNRNNETSRRLSSLEIDEESKISSVCNDTEMEAATIKKPVLLQQEEEYHWEVVERILFIYAKLNPGQSYVQGMNEIIGPIYYTLANDPTNLMWREHAEADTFYLFTNLMGEIRDFFIRSLDNSVSGIGRMMELLMGRLKGRDEAVYKHIVGLEIVPQYYAFRWITLLMSQEFPLPDVLRIWDSLLSDRKRFDFLIDLACAMIIHIRSDLLSGDFPTNMKLLQNYPPIDVRDILGLACSFSSPNVDDDVGEGEYNTNRRWVGTGIVNNNS